METAVAYAMASVMGLHVVPLLVAAIRGSPWNFRGRPWEVRGSPWNIRGCPRNTVDMSVECRGGPWTLPRSSAKRQILCIPPHMAAKGAPPHPCGLWSLPLATRGRAGVLTVSQRERGSTLWQSPRQGGVSASILARGGGGLTPCGKLGRGSISLWQRKVSVPDLSARGRALRLVARYPILWSKKGKIPLQEARGGVLFHMAREDPPLPLHRKGSGFPPLLREGEGGGVSNRVSIRVHIIVRKNIRPGQMHKFSIILNSIVVYDA